MTELQIAVIQAALLILVEGINHTPMTTKEAQVAELLVLLMKVED